MAGSVTVEIPVEVAAAATETAVEETPEAETESGASDEKSEA
jgi:hypothetical protein